MCDSWVGVHSVHHYLPKDHFLSFEIPFLNSKCNLMWNVVWMGLVWNIWKARNNVLFRNKIFYVEEVYVAAQINTWNWIHRN